ncbi:MAG: copper-binding protein [Zoogloeaceae bacterium]|jgi:Cu(I)/Ag(I) efflux system protein CusF|nr:copper-binding protein [Zoogloeaceae bacterium]
MKPHDFSITSRFTVATCLSALAFALTLTPPPALAQHDHHAAPPAQTAPAPIASGQGVVKKIDSERQRLTLAHAPIPALGWPAMTMPFAVSNPALLQGLKVGDTVEFDLKDEQTIRAIRRQ